MLLGGDAILLEKLSLISLLTIPLVKSKQCQLDIERFQFKIWQTRNGAFCAHGIARIRQLPSSFLAVHHISLWWHASLLEPSWNQPSSFKALNRQQFPWSTYAHIRISKSFGRTFSFSLFSNIIMVYDRTVQVNYSCKVSVDPRIMTLLQC